MTFCDLVVRLHERAITCVPADAAKDVQSSLAAIRSLGDEARSAGAPRNARDRTGALCAFNAIGIEGQLATRADLQCAVALSVDERERALAFLRAYYARRTKPRPTGNDGVDRQLTELAASRDALCSCTDAECVREAHQTVDAAVKPIPKEMKAAMEDAEALIDEVSRCAERVELGL